MPKKKAVSTRKRIPDVSMIDEFKKEQSDQKEFHLKPVAVRKAEALDILKGTTLPKNFLFREKEIQYVKEFITICFSKKDSPKYRILMLTGSPGAGKTLSVNYILTGLKDSGTKAEESLQTKQKKEATILPKNIEVIRFNANIIKTIRDVQQIICTSLLGMKHGNKMSTLQIVRVLEEEKSKVQCIIYIEEIEILLEKKCEILTEEFFLFFSNPKLKIMLLGVSNTIDAMAKYIKGISLNISEIKNIVFEPYEVKSVVKIMQTKLQEIHRQTGFQIQMSEKVLNYSAAKLTSTKKGDIRIVLQFLKRAVNRILPQSSEELQELEEKKQNCEDRQGPYTINIEVASKTLSKMVTVKNELMLQLPYQQQVVLIAMCLIIKKNECLYITMAEMTKEMKYVCDSLGLGFTHKMIEDGLEQLEQYSMAGKAKKNTHSTEMRIFLKASIKEIESAFWDHQLFGKFFEEEQL